jgi:hypothetical protein
MTKTVLRDLLSPTSVASKVHRRVSATTTVTRDWMFPFAKSKTSKILNLLPMRIRALLRYQLDIGQVNNRNAVTSESVVAVKVSG